MYIYTYVCVYIYIYNTLKNLTFQMQSFNVFKSVRALNHNIQFKIVEKVFFFSHPNEEIEKMQPHFVIGAY